MRQYIKFIPLLFFFQIGLAQYTDVINSKRPGFSDSPYSIGTGVYQVEGGLYYKNIDNYLNYSFLNGSNPDNPSIITHTYSSTAVGSDIMLRSGLFFERLELNVEMSVRSENRDVNLRLIDKLNDKNEVSSFNTSSFGLDKFNIGAKFLVYEPTYTDKSKEIRSWKARHSFDYKRLIPAVAIYAGINTNVILDDLYKNTYLQSFIKEYNSKLNQDPDIEEEPLDTPQIISGIGARFAIFTQNDISERWIILMNFIVDQVFTDFMESSFIGTTTYSLTPKFSVFGEGELFFRTQPGVPNDVQFGAGAAYLINKNIQVDIAGRMVKYLDRDGGTYLFNTGVTWRMDRHHDKIIKKEADNSKIRLPQEERSFLDKITFGLFAGKSSSKKVKNPSKVKTIKAKERKLEPPVNKKAAKAKKKRNKRLIKQQKQKEKAEKKYYKKKKKGEDQN